MKMTSNMKTNSNEKMTSDYKIISNMKTSWLANTNSNMKITSNMKTTSNMNITSNMKTASIMNMTSNMKNPPNPPLHVGQPWNLSPHIYVQAEQSCHPCIYSYISDIWEPWHRSQISLLASLHIPVTRYPATQISFYHIVCQWNMSPGLIVQSSIVGVSRDLLSHFPSNLQTWTDFSETYLHS